MSLCAGKTKDGGQCGHVAAKESDYCRHHVNQDATFVAPVVEAVIAKGENIKPGNMLVSAGNDPVTDAPVVKKATMPTAGAADATPASPPVAAPIAPPAEAANEVEIRETAMMRRKEARKARSGLGGYAGQRMLASQRKGFHRHWINDTGANLEEMLDRGYTFVKDETASINSDSLDSNRSLQVSKNGPPLTAYLMEIPDKVYQEDQDAKEIDIQKSENQIRHAADAGGLGGERTADGESVLYNPNEGGNQLLG